MTKSCELCASEAKLYCESDRARLCWDCDARVHGANFLVAKHSRTLLCRVCQSPTPWTGSGPKLGPTVSVCQSCLAGCYRNKTRDSEDEEEQQQQHQEQSDDQYDRHEDDNDTEEEEEENYDDESHEDDEDDDCMEEDEDEENQVVPWSKPGQPVSSSSIRQASTSVSGTAFSWRSRFS